MENVKGQMSNDILKLKILFFVIPAKAGIQFSLTGFPFTRE
jgi:hypothetical protein